MLDAWRAWSREPRPSSLGLGSASASASTWQRLDLVAAVVVVVVAILEVAVRADLVWRPVGVVVGLSLAALLPLRRRQPLWAMVLALAVGHVVAAAAFFAGVPWRDLGVEVIVLAFVYSLFRHGSGREGVWGLVVLAAVWGLAALNLTTNGTRDGADVVGSGVVLLLPAILGYAVRTQVLSQRRAVDAARDEVRTAERLRLARELHDTVAHHVSAIVIQARVGRAVAADAAAVDEVLRHIEDAAQASLGELRDVVGALRADQGERDDDAPLAPTAGLADLPQSIAAEPPGLNITLHNHLADIQLRSAVDVAAFRLIREALTNVRRHARPRPDVDDVDTVDAAVAVTVTLSVVGDVLQLVVDNDGAVVKDPGRGHGRVGMEERVRLLGGTIQSGPRATGGWRIEVRLPHAISRQHKEVAA